ncbi:MAG: SGNH/GDSL hydrolase family protein [Variibacter sp.]
MNVMRSLALGLPFALVLFSSPTLQQAAAQARAEVGQAAAPVCFAPKDLLQLGAPLPRVNERLSRGGGLKIVAVGSSSTAGAGASSPAMSYPSRLQAALREKFPAAVITVLNRGINGEEAVDMMKRFDAEVLAEHPDLVLWQVGTNAVLRDHAAIGVAPLIKEGLERLRHAGTDVVLIDPQFAPKVLAKPDVDAMVRLIGVEAKFGGAGLFQRFAIMRHWREEERIPFATLLSPDELHMNDWSYGCVAHLLAQAIGNAVHPATVARVPKSMVGR